MATEPDPPRAVYLSPDVIAALRLHADHPTSLSAGQLIGVQQGDQAAVLALTDSVGDTDGLHATLTVLRLLHDALDTSATVLGAWRVANPGPLPDWPPFGPLTLTLDLADRQLRCVDARGAPVPWTTDPFIDARFDAPPRRVVVRQSALHRMLPRWSEGAPDYGQRGGLLLGAATLSTVYVHDVYAFDGLTPDDLSAQLAELPSEGYAPATGVYTVAHGPLAWAFNHPWLRGPGRVALYVPPAGAPRAYTPDGQPIPTEVAAALPEWVSPPAPTPAAP